MTYVTLGLNSLLMIVIPILVGRLIEWKRKPGWRLFGIGAVTFVASQLAHIPFNWLVLQRYELISTDASIPSNLIILSLFLGFSAGIFEESARFLTLRYWAKDARTWGRGLMLGAGHGGIESILLGVIVGINYVVIARMREGSMMYLIPDGQLPMVQAEIELLFSTPWYRILLGAAERLFAICFHLLLTMLVMQTFIRRQSRWFLVALLAHAGIDSLAVLLLASWTPYQIEALLGGMALLSLILVFWLRTPEPVAPDVVPLPPPGPARPVDIELTPEHLDESRFH